MGWTSFKHGKLRPKATKQETFVQLRSDASEMLIYHMYIIICPAFKLMD